ncbi:MAG: glycosyltransferase [Bdellovibrionales bacterium]|nr:glycosyltransferase [Bdellovibrionales bacterium]
MISLVIPTYKREEYLVNSIKCALKQKDVEFEVIVVDQTKDHKPETTAFIESVKDKINYIFCEKPSVTNARNIGIQASKGEIVAFIDDDTEFNESFLSNHYKAHKNGADVVQGRVMEPDSKIQNQPTWVSPMIKFKGSDTCPTPGKTNSTTGCNFSISKKALDVVGGLDTNYYGCSVREDTDLGYRAYKMGLNVVFSPEAELFHHKSPSGGVDTGIKNQFFDLSYYFCELYFAKKHFSKLAIWNYKIRLLLRGIKQLRKLIKMADEKSSQVLERQL